MQQRVSRCALHWAASLRRERAYHLNIGLKGEVLHNAAPTTYLPRHTALRNTNTVAISCLGMAGPEVCFENFGKYPITKIQIERMCSEAGKIVDAYGLPIDSKHIFTHAEAALEDGYGPYQGYPDLRWDLMMLEPTRGLYTEAQCRAKATETGDYLRAKIRWYADKHRRAREGR